MTFVNNLEKHVLTGALRMAFVPVAFVIVYQDIMEQIALKLAAHLVNIMIKQHQHAYQLVHQGLILTNIHLLVYHVLLVNYVVMSLQYAQDVLLLHQILFIMLFLR